MRYIASARHSRDGWKLRSPIEANRCASFTEARFRYFQALIGSGDLLFQLVEFRIAKNLPPVSAARLVARLPGLPLCLLFEYPLPFFPFTPYPVHPGLAVFRTHTA